MKKLILTFGIFLAGIAFVNAQDVSTQTTKILTHLTNVCSLTSQQKAQVKPIAEALVKARMDAKQKYAGNLDGFKSANKSITDGFKSQLQSILTPEQMAKLQADAAKRKAVKKPDVADPASTLPPSNK